MDFATKRRMVPLQHKCLLTMQEAAQYSGIDINELQAILSDPDCDFVLQADHGLSNGTSLKHTWMKAGWKSRRAKRRL